MKKYTVDEIWAVMKNKGYTVFTSDQKPYNLNLVAVRSSANIPQLFDDALFVFWNWNGNRNLLQFKITTDPGLFYLHHPLKKEGTAILIPGQYRQVFKVGKHKGKEAFVQCAPMKYWRDSNKDSVIDETKNVELSVSATNLHRAGFQSSEVGKWSAGCQVMASDPDMELLIFLRDMSAKYWGEKFTYTLLEEADFSS